MKTCTTFHGFLKPVTAIHPNTINSGSRFDVVSFEGAVKLCKGVMGAGLQWS